MKSPLWLKPGLHGAMPGAVLCGTAAPNRDLARACMTALAADES